MASVAAFRPLPIRIQTDLDRFTSSDSITPVQHRFSAHSPSSSETPTSSTSPTPTRTSHYRPFSTLITQSPYIESHHLKRSSSIGGLQSLQMGLHFKGKQEPTIRRIQLSPAAETAIPSRPSLESYSTTPSSAASNGSTRLSPTHRMTNKKTKVSPPVTSHTAERMALTPLDVKRSSPISIAQDYPPSPLPTEVKRAPYKAASSSRLGSFGSAARRFVPKGIWAKRHNMKLHPYQKDVPYMQAYDPVLLESDRYTDLLLQRLSNGSPSFHDYGKKPPATVLDLGCGPGHWIVHATNIWKQSNFTGFDLVDVTLPDMESLENVHFVQGDFLNYRLPFPNKFFEYVRMANLVLCVPQHKWEHLLSEVHRILAPGGRLELIDDQIYFPYGHPPRDSPSSPSSSGFDDSDDDDLHGDDDETLHGEESESTLHGSSESGGSRPSSFDDPSLSKASICASDTVRPISHYLPPTPSCAEPRDHEFKPPALKGHVNYYSTSPVSSPVSPRFAGLASMREPRSTTWQRQAVASRNMEKVFERMLKEEYGIHPRPGHFVVDVMHQLFGKERSGKTKSFHVKLAPVDSPIGKNEKGRGGSLDDVRDSEDVSKSTPVAELKEDIDSVMSHPKKKKRWDQKIRRPALLKGVMSRDHSEDLPQLTISEPSPEFPSHGLSAKAAGRLGISYSALAAATAKSTTHRRSTSSSDSEVSGPSQHPGLLVWPSTYIPMGPAELEMHACKYMHTLLGCRPAVAEFVGKHVDYDGRRWVEDSEFREEIWEYECFRRSRFNWPSEVADPEDDPTNRNAYSSLDSPTSHSNGSSPSHHNSTGSLEAPLMMTRSTSASDSTSTPKLSHSDAFSMAKTLRGTRSHLLLRSSPPKGGSHSHATIVSAFKHIPRSRSQSPAPSKQSPPQSRGGSMETDTNFNGQYHRDELVHLRTIRVFEAIKADVHERPGTPDSF